MDDCRQQCYDRVELALRWPMGALAVVFTVAFVAGLDHRLDPYWLRASEIAQDVIWVVFALEYVVLLVLAPDKRVYLRSHVLEALSVLLPAFRLLRAVRVLRLVPGVRMLAATVAAGRGIKTGRRLLRRSILAYAGLSLVLVLLTGSAMVLLAERHTNPELGTYAECVWWSMVTMTTVGYGDVFPVTPIGKLLTMLLMVTGIGLMGVVTAAIASLFVEIEREDNDQALARRLDEMTIALVAIRDELQELRERHDDVHIA